MDPIIRQCPGCKTEYQYQEGPIDRYGVMSPECLNTLNELLLKEGEYFGYPPAHRLIIDSNAVQHPPNIELQLTLGINQRFIDASNQSVFIHLIALYIALEKKVEPQNISKIMDKILSKGVSFEKLETIKAPKDLGTIKIVDIRKQLENQITLPEYTNLAWDWARAAWNAWQSYHPIIKEWYEKYSK